MRTVARSLRPAKDVNLKLTRSTISTIVTALAVLILAAALPSAVRDTLETGRVYLFSHQFLEELPQRLTGPGRLRFLLQPERLPVPSCDAPDYDRSGRHHRDARDQDCKNAAAHG